MWDATIQDISSVQSLTVRVSFSLDSVLKSIFLFLKLNFINCKKFLIAETSFTVLCPDGWELFNGKCWYASSDKASWQPARDNCKKENINADLAIIHNVYENYHLSRHLSTDDAWIGLTR